MVFFGRPKIEVVGTAIYFCCLAKQSDYSPMKWSPVNNGKGAMKIMEDYISDPTCKKMKISSSIVQDNAWG